ncbi:TPA: ParB family protein [Pseudomonas aeruginosa]|nr:ParB family protein [Pseudomonas aeruginosa]
MADLTPNEMAGKLLTEGFSPGAQVAAELTDPIVDTPMVVTLDELRPYELDPRLTRNPLYDEIKASIKERGLDAAPPITRRPGADHFIIRNGGNTRLAILRELWSETKDERFFRIPCLFRPWPERGEIVALTGHLAENELRGGLTFIERALGVEKAREFYEEERGQPITQSELARLLRGDGYSVQQSHISRMRDAVQFLLPAIPNVLYAGLGRHQVERLAVIRKASERTWEHHGKGRPLATDFDILFQEVLGQFDVSVDDFSAGRVQDELIGQMSEMLGTNYDVLALSVNESGSRHRALTGTPAVPPSSATLSTRVEHSNEVETVEGPGASQNENLPPLNVERPTDVLQEHIVSPAPTTQRLQTIQRMVADEMGDEAPPDFTQNVLQSVPVQAGGVYPISDVWYIEPGLDNPDNLRTHISQFAREIAAEASLAHCIDDEDTGIGFSCSNHNEDMTPSGRAIVMLLESVSGKPSRDTVANNEQMAAALPALLHGQDPQIKRLSDTALVQLFRLVRLARRVLEFESEGMGRSS